jgi:hypothetical protein
MQSDAGWIFGYRTPSGFQMRAIRQIANLFESCDLKRHFWQNIEPEMNCHAT